MKITYVDLLPNNELELEIEVPENITGECFYDYDYIYIDKEELKNTIRMLEENGAGKTEDKT